MRRVVFPKDWQEEEGHTLKLTWGCGHQAEGVSAVIKILTLALLLVFGEETQAIRTTQAF